MDVDRVAPFQGLTNSNIKLVYAFKYRKSYYPYEFSNDSIKKQSNFIVIYDDEDCFVLGKNKLGCLGSTNIKDMNVEFKEPRQMNTLCKKKFKNFYNGSYHMVAFTEDNKLYCWGSNYYGQLGLKLSLNREEEPTEITCMSGKNIVDIKCGDLHTLALTKDGTLYGWGDNKFGQIGITSEEGKEYEPEPVVLEFSKFKVIAIACGSMHSMALCEDGTVYSWGYNKFGQCGFKNIEIVKPNPIKFPDIKLEIKGICCGRKSSYFISSENSDNLYSCGQSYLGTQDIFLPERLNGYQFNEINTIISGELIVLKDKEGKIWYFGNEYKVRFNIIKYREVFKKPKRKDSLSFDDFYEEKFNLTYGTFDYRNINKGESSNQHNNTTSHNTNSNQQSKESNSQNSNNSNDNLNDNKIHSDSNDSNQANDIANEESNDKLFEKFNVKNKDISRNIESVKNNRENNTNIEGATQSIVAYDVNSEQFNNQFNEMTQNIVKKVLSEQKSYDSIASPILENVHQDLSEVKEQLKHISEMMQNRYPTIANLKTEDNTNIYSNEIVKQDTNLKSDTAFIIQNNEKLLNNDITENIESTSKHINDIAYNNTENIESSFLLIEEGTRKNSPDVLNDISQA